MPQADGDVATSTQVSGRLNQASEICRENPNAPQEQTRRRIGNTFGAGRGGAFNWTVVGAQQFAFASLPAGTPVPSA
jgi:hypothetical protein